MTVRMSIFRKKPELQDAEFRAYWREVHAPIAVTIPSLQRYEQNCTLLYLPSGDPALRQPVDGICKLNFASETAMQGVMLPQMASALQDDEAQFIEGLRTFVVTHCALIPVQQGATTKCVTLVTRRPGLAAPEFETVWLTGFADRVARLPGVAGYAQNFVTARTAARIPVAYEDVPVDCIDELWLVAEPGTQAFLDCVKAMQRDAAQYAAALNTFVVTVNVPAIP